MKTTPANYQELFTVGKDGSATYTEDDVVAAARVLTGWRINFLTAASLFRARRPRPPAPKYFLLFTTTRSIQGSSNGAQNSTTC